MWLPGGFVAGVDKRFGFTPILGAKAFLFAGVGVLDVERAAEFSAIENIPAFHNSDFSVRAYEAVRDLWCIHYTKRVANPVFTSSNIYPMIAGLFARFYSGFDSTGTFTGTEVCLLGASAGF